MQARNAKHTAVICFGKGYHIAKHISSEKVAAYRYYDNRTKLKEVIGTDKELCEKSLRGMSEKNYLICADLYNGGDKVDNEELEERAAKQVETELKNYIRKLKLKGVNKIIVIAYSGLFEYYGAQLVHNTCQKEALLCEIYAYHIGKELFPDVSPQEKRLYDLQKKCGAEILFYPANDEDYCTPNEYEDMHRQYAKTIEYTCF